MFELKSGQKAHLVVSRVKSGKINRYRKFHSCKTSKMIDSWSATRLFAPGDLAFFYFGKPIGSIVAIAGVDSKPRDCIGRFDWTKRRKATFCKYRPVWFLKKQIQLSEGQINTRVSKWWKGKPYRRTQKIPEKVALALLFEGITFNPKIKTALIKEGIIIPKRP